MRWLLLVPLAAALTGCVEGDINYHPAPQILPQSIHNIGINPIVNQTQQFGLEEKLYLRVQDEFFNNGQFPMVAAAQADGQVNVILKKYILTPIQYDSNLVPTVYRLQVYYDLQFIDRAKNQILWQEPNLTAIQTYSAPTLPGGMTEPQAQVALWDTMSRDIVTRTITGFGSVTGESGYKVNVPPPPPPGQSLQVPGLATPAGTQTPGQPKGQEAPPPQP